MKFTEELKLRGLIADMVNPEVLEKKLDNEKLTFYAGFDCTADSLTLGHYFLITVFKRFQLQGHRPIVLIGGATTMIGDPSDRNDMRKMLTEETIDYNASRFREQLSKYIDFSNDRAIFLNNKDWLLDLNFLDFVRTIGINYNVSRMIHFDCYKNRLNNGLTFFEFSYMLMQGYDYLKIHKEYDCTLQLAGSDQWSNALGGLDLIKKMSDKEAFIMTIPLITTSSGVKMGKSMGGALWLDPLKTSPYEIFQYFRNTEDVSVEKFMKMLTFIPLDEIEKIIKEEDINKQKEILAYEITKDIHGEEEAKKALETARNLFGGKIDADNIPIFEIEDNFGDEIGLLNILTLSKLTTSNSEARTLILQGGITIDDEKVEDTKMTISRDVLKKGIVVKKGKKKFLKIIIK